MSAGRRACLLQCHDHLIFGDLRIKQGFGAFNILKNFKEPDAKQPDS